MCAPAATGTIPAMIRTDTPPKLTPVTERRADGGPSVRRYRLARLRLDGRPAGWTIRSNVLRAASGGSTLKAGAGPASARYAFPMQTNLEARPPRTPILKRAAAGLILVAVAALAVHFFIGLIMTVFWLVVAVAAVVAVIWALKTI